MNILIERKVVTENHYLKPQINMNYNKYLKKNETWEDLGNNTGIITSKTHHFTTDTLLLADFSSPKRNQLAIEFGSGCGTIPILWNRDNSPPLHTLAVEIQESACDMMKRSIEINHFEEKISVLNEDIKNLDKILTLGKYNLIVCNPPYKKNGNGITNQNDELKIARHEFMCNIDDITNMASKLLNTGGIFCMCQRPERLCDVLISMRNSNIEPKLIRFVQQRINKKPSLFLIQGKRNAKPGLFAMNTLIMEDENGNSTPEIDKIYGAYRNSK